MSSTRSTRKPARLSIQSLERRELFAVTPVSVFSLASAAAGSDTAHDVAVDSAGNTYVTGGFTDTVDFDPGPGEYLLTSNGLRDIFVAKYAPDDSLVWVRSFGGAGWDNHSMADSNGPRAILHLDASGASYVLGSFEQTVAFDHVTLTADEARSEFLLRLDADGAVSWAREFDLATPMSFVVDDRAANSADWSVYLVGRFAGAQTFGSQAFNSVSGSSDGFLSRIDAASGAYEWTKVTTGKGGETFHDVTLDTSGSGAVLIGGDFSGNALVGSQSLKSSGDADGMVVKADLNGNFLWSKATATGRYYGSVRQIATNDGQIFIAGLYEGRADFERLRVNGALFEMFIARLDASGKAVWAKTTGGSPSPGYGREIRDFVTDASGNVFLAGAYFDETTFGSITLPAAIYTDGYVAQLSQANGAFMNAWRLGGSQGFNAVGGLALDENGNLAACGNFQGMSVFPDGTVLTANGDLADLFILRFADVTSAAMSAPASKPQRLETLAADLVFDALFTSTDMSPSRTHLKKRAAWNG